MLRTQTRYAIDPTTAKTLDTEQLRNHFHIGELFHDGAVNLVYSHYDRLIVGGAVPAGKTLTLDHVAETGTANMLERREMGVLNIGEEGEVSVGGNRYPIKRGEILYIGMGSGVVEFSGAGRFYFLSAPAHRSCPTRLVRLDDAKKVPLGSKEQANERVIYQLIHPDVVESFVCDKAGHIGQVLGTPWILKHPQPTPAAQNAGVQRNAPSGDINIGSKTL
ncbi:4-deoxy-L-threo-5-hexosulose-uronate ketol-isomerase [Nymphon striatum]|nr:4-deoxy-L-threo-5-hexosulose-uronate ketol-isomerase [Nymphon striatum]